MFVANYYSESYSQGNGQQLYGTACSYQWELVSLLTDCVKIEAAEPT
jgi:hypothetical protein